MEPSWLALAVCIASGAILSCKPSPKKVCDHAVELSPAVAVNECVGELSVLQRRGPEQFDGYAKCAMDAKNVASFAECRKELEVKLAAAVKIVVTADGVSLNGTKLAKVPTVDAFAEVLGTGSTESDKKGTWHTYAPYGLDVLKAAANASVFKLNVSLSDASAGRRSEVERGMPAAGAFSPTARQAFSGSLSIGGTPVTGTTTRDAIGAIPGVKVRERDTRLELSDGTVVKFGGVENGSVTYVSIVFANPDAPAELPELSLPSEIDSVTIENRGKGEVVLKKQGAEWVVVKPVQGAASETNIKTLLDNLRELRLESEMKPTPLERAEKGLDAGHLLRVVVSGGGETLDVAFAKGGSLQTPAILRGDLRVFSVSGLSAYLYEREPERWLQSPPAQEP